MYQDKVLQCRECGCEFIFTASEQAFYAERGFENLPGRCPECRRTRKAAARGPREMYDATCAQCGATCQVPFQPTGEKPVYCSDCFRAQRG